MSKLFNWAAARIVAAFALALPLAAMAATPVAVWDGDFNDLTKFTGYELVDWNETHGENKSSCTIDRANHGLMFNAESAMPGMTILVRYSNLTVGSSKKVLFTSCVNSNHSGYRTGVRLGTDGKICGMWQSADNGTASGSVPESGVMAFTYSTAGTYLYAAEKGTESLKQVWGSSALKSSNDTAIYGGSAGGFCDGSSISGFSAASGMTIDALAVFNSVVSLAEMQEYLWPEEDVCAVSRTVAADATVNWADAAWTVGETADQTFTPLADALYNVTVTVGGDCTIVMPETIGTFNRRRIKFVLDDGVGSATVALKYPGTLPETGSSVELDPFGDALVVAGSGVTLSPGYNGDTAGYMVSVSGLTVTIVKGSNYEGTLTADTNWSAIKPEGWADAIAGDEPSIVVNYEGEDPITLTFDEAVQAGSLTITGNIIVEASAAAAFGTITAGAGSVVEMANVAVTTQSPSSTGTFRYRSNYPSAVQHANLTYEYVGSDDSANPGTVSLGSMKGTVKTTGYMNITGYYPVNVTRSTLDVVSGTTTLTAGTQGICGNIIIREGATLVNTTTDSLAYSSYNTTIDIYGTLDMGTSRWTTWSGAAINLRGGEITGVGEGNNGAIDLMGIGNVHAYADSTISANVKFRNDLSNVTVDNGVTLTISGVTKPGYNSGGITKKGNGTLKFTSDPYVPAGITVEDGTLAFDTQSDVDPVVTYTASVLKDANMDYVSASNWKGTVIVSAVAAGDTATQIALNKTGNANSYLTLNAISGNAWCAGSDYTVQPEITLAGDVNFQNGSSKKTVTFRKIAAGTGNLSLKSWANCTGITYGFTALDADNYTGTIQLDGSVLTFNVGDILKTGAAVGDKVLPLTVTNSAAVNFNNATLNGKAAGFELREDGVYYTTAYVAVNVPKVANTTVAVSVGGNPVSPATEGESTNTYSVAEGATVTVTYSSDDYEVTGGTFEFAASEGYTVDTTGVTTAQYVASITVGEATTKYTSLQAAVDAVAQNKDIVLLDNVVDGATVDREVTFSVVPGEYTYGDIVADGDYVLTTTALEGKTRYTFAQAVIAVTINEVRTLYTMMTANTGIEAANAGPIGTTIEILSGDPSTYVEYLPMFDLNTVTGIFTKVANPVAAVYDGVLQVQVYRSLAEAVATATAGQTVTLLADDHVSFSASNLEIGINKALTIDGGGFTIYGVNDYAYDGEHDHDIFISGSGDITIKNVTLSGFGGAAKVNLRTYPIWVGLGYTGTLTLDGVTVTDFNRTALNFNGGTVVVTNSTITGSTAAREGQQGYFQSGINIRNADVTIADTTITSVGSTFQQEDSDIASAVQLDNNGAGTATISGGTYSGEYGVIVASNANGTVSISGGTFTGNLLVEEGEGSGSIAVSGGTFDAEVPAEYCADGYEPKDNGDGTYGVREDKGWIFAEEGYWNYTGTWSGIASAGEKVTVETNATYTASKASAGQMVTIAMELSFDDANDEDEAVGDAKAAIRLASGETEGTYQFQLYTSDGVNMVWTNATVGTTATKEHDYTFIFVLDLTNKVYTASVVDGGITNMLSIGDSVTQIPFAYQGTVTPVQQIDFVGSGTVSSIEGSYETPEEPPAPEGFDEDDTIGEVTLTAEQATWLNGQNNYLALAEKIATMSQEAFNKAYLLNLNVTDPAYDGTFTFEVTDFTVGDTTVSVEVSLTRNGELEGPINGTLKLTGTDELGNAFEVKSSAIITDEHFSSGDGTTTISFTKDVNTKFFKPVIE